MIFSYRTRQFLRQALAVALVLALLLAIALVCFAVWLRRFVVYTPAGVRLDWTVTDASVSANRPTPPEKFDISVEFAGQGDLPQQQPELLQRLSGYYIDPDMMKNDLSGLRQQLAQLPAGTAVMLDVKSFWGYFYYTTTSGPASESFILAEVDALIAQLAKSDLYVIARLPALRDYEYAKSNTSCGLPTKKGYLWTDESSCYWLDPTNDGTLTHLIQLTKELRALGFDEVVFQDFYVPESSKIVFNADRREAIEAAAQTLVTSCATDSFTVSFVGYLPDLKLPEEHCRLYLANVAAVDVEDILAQVQMADTLHNVVFLAQTNDTRYDVCGTLRPLELAH